jgi:anti-repressor protein
MELIKIQENNGDRVVSARELFDFLEIKENFPKWITRMFDYGFTQNTDYQAINIFVDASNGIGGTNKTDYALTLDCAKEIAMIQRSIKGKQAREYFIACEKQLKENRYLLPQTFSEALRQLADSKEREENALIELKNATQKIDTDKPKVLFAESVTGSSNSILIRKFAKDLCDPNFEIGQNRLFDWFRENEYINKDNEPYQKYVAQGLFEVITRSVGSSANTFTTKTTKITGKGQVYFAEKIKQLIH